MTKLQILTALFTGIVGLPATGENMRQNPALVALITYYTTELSILTPDQISAIVRAVTTGAYSIANQGVPVDKAVAVAIKGLTGGTEFAEAVLRTC